MDVRLEVVHDKSRVRHVRLRRDTVVGRGRDCQLRIPVADVSRQHCRFMLEEHRLLIRDLGSSNGTQLGGKSIPSGKDILLADGDAITVGPVSFIVHLADAATEPTPPTDSVHPLPESTDPVPASQQDTAEFDSATPDDAPADFIAGEEHDTSDDASVVDLELSPAADEPDGEADDHTADEGDEPVAEEPPEKPLKSRSLFGLFRRRTAASDDDLNEDDLMEEPGEDPPIQPDADADPEALDDGSLAAGHPAAAQSDTVNGLSVDAAAKPETGASVFDDESSDEELVVEEEGDAYAADEGDVIEEIAEDGDAVTFDFLEEETDTEAPADDDLDNFLGQFGD